MPSIDLPNPSRDDNVASHAALASNSRKPVLGWSCLGDGGSGGGDDDGACLDITTAWTGTADWEDVSKCQTPIQSTRTRIAANCRLLPSLLLLLLLLLLPALPSCPLLVVVVLALLLRPRLLLLLPLLLLLLLLGISALRDA